MGRVSSRVEGQHEGWNAAGPREILRQYSYPQAKGGSRASRIGLTRAGQGRLKGRRHPPPSDYSSYLVYIADGVWDPADPNFTPPTMDSVLRERAGYSDAEMAQFEADGKAFFTARFGLDADDPANSTTL